VTETRKSPDTVPERSSPREVILGVDEALHVALQLHRAGYLPEAETLYRRIVAVTPENLNALHFLGLLCHRQNRNSEAAELIGRIIALDPQNADAHNNLGNVLARLGKNAEAEASHRRAIALRPDHASAYNNLGVVLMAQSRVTEAVEARHRAVALAPESADAHNNLGNVLAGLGKNAEAEASHRRAIALRPDHGPAHSNLGGVLLEQSRVAEAVEAYRRAVALEPESADFHYNLGNALRRSGNLEEAAGVYRKAVALKPEHAGARRGLTRTLILAGRRDEAARVFDEWFRQDPENPVIVYLRAACLGQGAPDRAPDAYVEQLFDDMADNFDAHMVENLDYRAPGLLCNAIAAALPPPASVLDIVDAGCGTGLCAALLRPYARRLIGVDLSAGMLGRAAERQAYDDLVKAELTDFLGRSTETYDVIASADTLCYFGPLEPVIQAAATALKPGGLLAFTLENGGNDGPDFRLQPHGRYAHARGYVEGALGGAGLVVHSIASVVLRKESGEPVAGHLVVAKKQPGAC
jgi:predicted TPR repeat methyltransferase